MKFLFAISLLSPFIIAACGEGDDTVTREAFCTDWAEAACSDETVSACQAASPEACRNSQAAFCLDLVPDELAQGAIGGCLGAVADAYADADLTAEELPTVLRLEGACRSVTRGPRLENDACTTDLQCDGAAGLVCVLRGGDPEGTCQIPEEVEAGFACDEPQQVCATGFYCDGENCIASEDPGSPCTTSFECGLQAFCGPDSACTERFGVAAACTEDEQCLSDLCFTFEDGEQTCIDRLRLSRSEPLCDALR